MSDEIKKIRELSNKNFVKMLRLVELGINNWWTASAILAIAYDDNLTEKQKGQIRKSFEEKFGEFPDIESFLKLGRKTNKLEDSFFLPYENHARHHEFDSNLTNPDPDCVICQLLRKAAEDS